MGVLDAVEKVLNDAGTPLRCNDIAQRVLEEGLWQTHGLTPKDTISAQLAINIKTHGAHSRFQRTGKGLFALRSWGLPVYDVQAVAHRNADAANGRHDETILLPPVVPIVSTHTTTTIPSGTTNPPAAGGPLATPMTPATMSFTDAAEYVLKHFAERKPLHYRDITQRALEHRLVKTSGRTPEATLYAQLLSENARRVRRGETPRFVKQGRGYVGLTAWQGFGLASQIEQHNAEVRKKLHTRLQAMPPEDFEALVGQLLAAIGFADVEVTSKSGDGGIDVRGTLVVGDVIRTRMAVQVKRWRNNVLAPTVQQVRGALGAHEQGLIITTSGFSQGAREEARRADATPVGIMDGQQLVALLVEHDIGIHRTTHDLIELGDIEPE